jgi:hypothetical protein
VLESGTWAACRCGRLEKVTRDTLSRHAVCYWSQLYSVLRKRTSNTRVIYWRDSILRNERMWTFQNGIILKSQNMFVVLIDSDADVAKNVVQCRNLGHGLCSWELNRYWPWPDDECSELLGEWNQTKLPCVQDPSQNEWRQRDRRVTLNLWTSRETKNICGRNSDAISFVVQNLNLAELLLLLSSSSSPLCRVSTHTFPRQTMSLGNTLLQLFCLVCGASISSSCVGSFVLLR